MIGEELLELELSKIQPCARAHVAYVKLWYWYNANTSPPRYSYSPNSHYTDDLYIGNTLPVSMEAVKAGRKRRASDSSETHAGTL